MQRIFNLRGYKYVDTGSSGHGYTGIRWKTWRPQDTRAILGDTGYCMYAGLLNTSRYTILYVYERKLDSLQVMMNKLEVLDTIGCNIHIF